MFLLPAVLLSFAPHTFRTPTIEIAPGVHLPLVGIGTWQYNNSVTEAAVLSALSMGYEHVDTALGYENAAGVARALAKSGRTRASYFITSKIPGGLGETVAVQHADSAVLVVPQPALHSASAAVLPRLGCSTHSRGVPRLFRPQWQHVVLPPACANAACDVTPRRPRRWHRT